MKPITFLFLLFLVSGLWASPSLANVFESSPAGTSSPLSETRVADLLAVAVERDWNVFDLLNQTGLYLKAQNKRIVIDGSDLRMAAKEFSLGGTRVDVLFPLPLVESVTTGARLGADADIEIRLSRPFSAFLELGDFDLETIYGFREVGERELGSAFGVSVRNGPFRWTLQKIARVSDPTGKGSLHFIAIHLDNLFRPKRWKIEAISALERKTKP